ncbi:MAG TPA: hypothetical protein VF796_14515 [Humisphaera sp.]
MHFLKSEASHASHLRAAVDKQAAHCLGWASIAVGLTELLAPKQLEKTMGVGNGQTTGILRVLGVRELMHGIDLLSHRDPTPGAWSRVFGDLLDGVLLGAAATRTKNPGGLALVAAAVTPLVLADMIFAPRLSKDRADGRIDD